MSRNPGMIRQVLMLTLWAGLVALPVMTSAAQTQPAPPGAPPAVAPTVPPSPGMSPSNAVPLPPTGQPAPGTAETTGGGNVQQLQQQLELTRRKLEGMQQQFQGVQSALEQTTRELDRLQGGTTPGTTVTSTDDPSWYPADVKAALETARSAVTEAEREQSASGDQTVKAAWRSYAQAAQQLETVARQAADARKRAEDLGQRQVAELERQIESADHNARSALQDALRSIKDTTREADQEAQQAMREAEQALREANQEVREAQREAKDQVREAEETARDAMEQAARAGERVAIGTSSVVKAGERVPELVVIKGNGDVFGEVEGDAVVMAGDLVIHPGGRVRGDGVVMGGKLTLMDGGRIDGERVELERGKFVDHLLNGRQVVETDTSEDNSSSFGDRVRSRLIIYLLLVAGGLMSLTFIPDRVQGIAQSLEQRTTSAGVIGALALIAVLPVTLMLVLTLIGILLVPFVYGGVLLIGVVGVTALAQVLGQRIPYGRSAPKTPGGALLWGMALFMLATLVPYLGVLIAFIGTLVGLGAVILSRFGDQRDLA